MNTNYLTINWVGRNFLMTTLIILLVMSVGCKKEDDTQIEESDLCLVKINGVFEEVELDEVPTYLDGGKTGFLRAVLEELNYPPEARELGIEGWCVVQYEITVDGEVENVTAIQDPGGGIGEATINAVETVITGTVFSPGIIDGVPVRVKKEFKVNFKLG